MLCHDFWLAPHTVTDSGHGTQCTIQIPNVCLASVADFQPTFDWKVSKNHTANLAAD